MPDCLDCLERIPDFAAAYAKYQQASEQPPIELDGWRGPVVLGSVPGLAFHLYEDCYFTPLSVNRFHAVMHYVGGKWEFFSWFRDCMYSLPRQWTYHNFWAYRGYDGQPYVVVYDGKVYAGNLLRYESRGATDSWRVANDWERGSFWFRDIWWFGREEVYEEYFLDDCCVGTTLAVLPTRFFLPLYAPGGGLPPLPFVPPFPPFPGGGFPPFPFSGGGGAPPSPPDGGGGGVVSNLSGLSDSFDIKRQSEEDSYE